MEHIIFIQGGGHGGYRADQKLVDSLKNHLGNDFKVDYPEIHSTETEADYGWTDQIDRAISKGGDHSILVGHSFGASMILKYLAEHPPRTKIKGIFLLATPFWRGEEPWVKGLMPKAGFAGRLPQGVPLVLYHAKDDDEIPFSHFRTYQKEIPWAKYRAIDTGGHQFNNDLSPIARDILAL